MVVIAVMVILLSMALPIYSASLRQAREDSFRQNLETLNRVIYQYTLDKQKPPKSLEDLKAGKYIDKVPNDITGQQTWVMEEDDSTIMSTGQTESGVYGVHSASNQTGQQRQSVFGMVDSEC